MYLVLGYNVHSPGIFAESLEWQQRVHLPEKDEKRNNGSV